MIETIRPANVDDAPAVAEMVGALLTELRGLETMVDLTPLEDTARILLDGAHGYWAWLAPDATGAPAAVLTLNECASVYAGGHFGEICELYVRPDQRSTDVGRRLLDQATAFGRQRSWSQLEVGAPSLPRWARTVAFYKNNGFTEVGPRLNFKL